MPEADRSRGLAVALKYSPGADAPVVIAKGRGLIAEETAVSEGMKIGDVDARIDRNACFTISDKALAIGGGVLSAILTHFNNSQPTAYSP